MIVDPREREPFQAVTRSPYVSAMRGELTVEGVPLRLHLATREDAGAVLLHATGSEAHVRALAERAQARGLSLRADGLFAADGCRSASSAEEAGIYEQLGLCFVPPELRGDATLPTVSAIELVERPQLRGAVHCHTTYSDGKHSVADMARAAQELGFEYITITDHSPSAHYAGGVDLER